MFMSGNKDSVFNAQQLRTGGCLQVPTSLRSSVVVLVVVVVLCVLVFVVDPGSIRVRTLRQFMRTLVNRLHGLNIANLRILLNPRSKTNKTWRCLVVVWHQEATFFASPSWGMQKGLGRPSTSWQPFLETIKAMLGPRSSRNSTWSLICIAWEISSGCIFETCTTSDARRRSAASDGTGPNWTESSLHIFVD